MNVFSYILISVLVLIVIAVLLVYVLWKRDMSKSKEDLLSFLEENPEICSITLIQNETERLNLNGNVQTPLASTVKIIILLAFVKAVHQQRLNPDKTVNITEIDALYFENTDGNAHPTWKKEKQIGQEVTLLEVAQGMMQYSSNACTDYLYSLLGAEQVNHEIKEHALIQHTSLYAINSAMLIPAYLKVEKSKNILEDLKKIPQQEYEQLADLLLSKVRDGKATEYLKELSSLSDMKIQSELTKRFPSSTTSEYAQLMNLIGNSDRLSLEEKDLVDNILNSFSATNKRQWYKGGSTAFVLTSAMYIQIEKETLALSVFIRDEKRLDLLWIERVIHDFLRSLIKDNAFREQVIQRLEDNQQSEKVVNV